MLALVALVLAVGAAIASQSARSTIGYRWIPDMQFCKQLTSPDVCSISANIACTVTDPDDTSTVHLRRDDDPTPQGQCGPLLYKNN